DLPIMGLTFSVQIAFDPNLGLIPGHFANSCDYFHCEMMCDREPMMVGFPYSSTGVTLYTQHPALQAEGPRVIRAILAKYEKYVRASQLSVPAIDDPTRRLTVVCDDVVVIVIQEGNYLGRNFLRIEYRPAPHGPLDQVSEGDREFVRFASNIADLQ